MAKRYALECATYPGPNCAYKRGCLLQVVITSNGSALAIDAARSAPGFTITTGASGASTGTCPSAARGVILVQEFDTAATALLCNVTAYDPKAGTFALQTHNDNAEGIVPNGGELWLTFFMEGG